MQSNFGQKLEIFPNLPRIQAGFKFIVSLAAWAAKESKSCVAIGYLSGRESVILASRDFSLCPVSTWQETWQMSKVIGLDV